MQTEEVPSRLGSFDIEGILGEGGSAIVYAALDGDRPVALKVLRPDAGLDPREVDRFLDEAERMRRVSHPSLVQVLRAGLLPGGRPYIAMPRVRGRNLAERLSEGPIPLESALPLFEGVADAVASLHEAGLVHRDIKPENVLWSDEEPRLVLLDLGIARDAHASPSTTTRAGFMRGTPAYMAPERFMGKRATERSDIYELALLFYVMLTARLPWNDDDPRGRLEPKPPSSHGVILPEALSNTLLAAITIDVEHRPASVDDLVARIKQAVQLGWAPRTSARPPASDAPHTPIVITPPKPQSHSGFPPPASPAFGQAATQRSRPFPRMESGPPPPMTAQGGHTPPGAQAPQSAHTPQGSGPHTPQGTPTPSGSHAPYAAVGLSGAPPPMMPTPQSWFAPPVPPSMRRSSSSGALVAIGATIALLSALGGAVVVGWFVLAKGDTKSDDRKSARQRDDDDAPSKKASSASAQPSVTVQPSAEPDASADAAPLPETSAPGPGGSAGRGRSAGSPSSSAGPASSGAPSSTPVTSKGMPAACAGLIALMCDPNSGATPEECTAWKNNVQSWRQKLPDNVTAETCQAALDQSRSGLAMRKKSKPPGGP